MELKRTLLGGYSIQSVHDALKKQKNEFMERIKRLESLNDDFRNQLNRYQEKEIFISEALVEAKTLSKTILLDSEVKANALIQSSEKELIDRLEKTKREISELEEMKQQMLDQEEFMKIELKQLFRRHLDMVDKIDLQSFKDSKIPVEYKLNASNSLEREKESSIQQKTDPIKPRTSTRRVTQKTVDQIPVFTFEQF